MPDEVDKHFRGGGSDQRLPDGYQWMSTVMTMRYTCRRTGKTMLCNQYVVYRKQIPGLPAAKGLKAAVNKLYISRGYWRVNAASTLIEWELCF